MNLLQKKIDSLTAIAVILVFSIYATVFIYDDIYGIVKIAEMSAEEATGYANIEDTALSGPNNKQIKSVPRLHPRQTRRLTAEISAYTSSVEETDSTPFITASGEYTRPGIIANNCLPFGTQVEVEGQVYTVEDRMNSRYGCEHFDIWMAQKDHAIIWGRRELEVIIYE